MSISPEKFVNRCAKTLDKEYDLEVKTINDRKKLKLQFTNKSNKKTAIQTIARTPSDVNYKKAVVDQTVRKLHKMNVNAKKDDFNVSFFVSIK